MYVYKYLSTYCRCVYVEYYTKYLGNFPGCSCQLPKFPEHLNLKVPTGLDNGARC